MHVRRTGPMKYYTAVEEAFAHAARTTKPKQYPNPDAQCNGSHMNNPYAKYQEELVKSAMAVRQKLISEVETYTGKPIEQFANEVREWRNEYLLNKHIPFPSTTYNPS